MTIERSRRITRSPSEETLAGRNRPRLAVDMKPEQLLYLQGIADKRRLSLKAIVSELVDRNRIAATENNTAESTIESTLFVDKENRALIAGLSNAQQDIVMIGNRLPALHQPETIDLLRRKLTDEYVDLQFITSTTPDQSNSAATTHPPSHRYQRDTLETRTVIDQLQLAGQGTAQVIHMEVANEIPWAVTLIDPFSSHYSMFLDVPVPADTGALRLKVDHRSDQDQRVYQSIMRQYLIVSGEASVRRE